MYNGKIKALDTPVLLKQSMPQEQVLEVKCLGDLDKEMFEQLPESVSLHLGKLDGLTYVRMNTDNPESLLSRVIDTVRDRVKVLSVIVTSPTLEDVFVHLTGASLKDDYSQRQQNDRRDR